VPSLLNDDGAFLSFICSLTAIEALGGFLCPREGNGQRFKEFVCRFFREPYAAQAELLWKLRNAAIHGFSPGPYKLTHHQSRLHMTIDGGAPVLNAEDLYADLVLAARKYFTEVETNAALQVALEERAKQPDTGVLVVAPPVGKP